MFENDLRDEIKTTMATGLHYEYNWYVQITNTAKRSILKLKSNEA